MEPRRGGQGANPVVNPFGPGSAATTAPLIRETSSCCCARSPHQPKDDRMPKRTTVLPSCPPHQPLWRTSAKPLLAVDHRSERNRRARCGNPSRCGSVRRRTRAPITRELANTPTKTTAATLISIKNLLRQRQILYGSATPKRAESKRRREVLRALVCFKRGMGCPPSSTDTDISATTYTRGSGGGRRSYAARR